MAVQNCNVEEGREPGPAMWCQKMECLSDNDFLSTLWGRDYIGKPSYMLFS